MEDNTPLSNNEPTKRKTALNDDDWWEAVLAEERQYAPRPPQGTIKSKLAPSNVEKTDPHSARQMDWAAIRDLYANDRIVDVEVSGHNRGGLLVEKDGISGFIPFSHLIDLAGKEQEVNHDISLEVYVGKVLKVKVIECIPEEGRIVFSERAALAEPGKRTELLQQLRIGSQVSGVVTNITDFGVFVDLGAVEGLIHISELSWGRVSHPNQIVKLGDEVTVQVLDVFAERRRVALSLKRITPNPWERASTDFSVSSIHTAVITSVMSYGAFARLGAGVEGLIHASEMPLEQKQTPRDILKEGQQVRVRVLHLDIPHQRMGLSIVSLTEKLASKPEEGIKTLTLSSLIESTNGLNWESIYPFIQSLYGLNNFIACIKNGNNENIEIHGLYYEDPHPLSKKSELGPKTFILSNTDGGTGLTLRSLENQIIPYIKSLTDFQVAINELINKPESIKIISITKMSPVSVSLEGAGEALRIIESYIAPWKRKHEESIARLLECKKETDIEIKKAEVLERRALASKERQECQKLQAEVLRQKEEVNKMRLENEKLQLDIHRTRVQLALEIIAELKPNITEEEKISYVIKLLPSLTCITESPFDIATSK